MLLKLISSFANVFTRNVKLCNVSIAHVLIFPWAALLSYNTLPFIKIHNTGYIFIITMSKVLAKTKISA